MKINQKFKKYQKNKIVDLKILEKYKVYRKHLLLFFVLLLLFLLNKKYFLFIAVTAFSAIFGYYHSKYNRTPIDFKLALFLGLFITRYYGLLFTLIFFIISDIIPALLSGDSLNGPDLFFIGWFFIINTMVYIFPSVPLSILGPMLVAFESTGAIMIHMKIGGIPGFMSIWIQIINVLARIVYFMIFSDILEKFFKVILL